MESNAPPALQQGPLTNESNAREVKISINSPTHSTTCAPAPSYRHQLASTVSDPDQREREGAADFASSSTAHIRGDVLIRGRPGRDSTILPCNTPFLNSMALSQPPKPYYPKRPHKKSRKGCNCCKTRKVKCDESRPVCRACRLRGDECVYLDQSESSSAPDATAVSLFASQQPRRRRAPHRWNVYFPGSTISVSHQASCPPTRMMREATPRTLVQPLLRPSGVDEVDMKLLWFYTTATCSSFSVEGGTMRPVEDLMRSTVVQYAFQAPFLMHSLLALSSLHLQTLGLTFDQARALEYRVKSFEGYRKAVEDPKPEIYTPLLVNSLLLTALSSQNFREPESRDLYIIDWMIIWRGIGLIVDLTNLRQLTQTGLEVLFYRPHLDLERAANAIPGALLEMVDAICFNDGDYSNVQTYYATLKYLGSLYQNLRQDGFGAVMRLRIITWFTFLPRQFVELARRKKPRALVIIAHYVTFLKLMGEVWWLKGVGNRSLDDLCTYLGPEWHPFLETPLNVLRLEDELSIARLILQDPSWRSPSPSGRGWDAQQEAATRQLTWVDDEGREVRFNGEDRVLAHPHHVDEAPTWHIRS